MSLIKTSSGFSCETRPSETVLTALSRAGLALSAPCGGRGICGKCRILLREGKVRLVPGAADNVNSGPDGEVRPGGFFHACRGIALSDIIIELPDETYREAPARFPAAPGERSPVRRAGLGLDIGTTTVSAELIDLDSGESLETVSALNAQRSFGADVMNRIGAARNGKTGELFAAINRQTEGLLRDFMETWTLPRIERLAVSGNTTMLHLFAGADPSGMGELPFTPEFLEERHLNGHELSLPVENITLLPGISAFVGADIVSGLAFLDILNREDASFLVDIGTNGEMALFRRTADGGRLFCASTAAGPCFEGAEISCGMGALPGAINRVRLEGQKPVCATLGNIPPRGICGAGLIDALAVMKRLDVFDETGALADAYAEGGFPLAEGISISGRDLRQFQLAKSAILSGIQILCRKAEIELAGLSTVYIAGGLGFFINTENAVTAGLFPREFAEGPAQTAVCGNLSLKGAVQSLREPSFSERCRRIVSRSGIVELAADPGFMEAFAENMYF